MNSPLDPKISSGPIGWMASNPVAANLLMLLLLVGGVLIGRHIKQEVFPTFELDTVSVVIAYPGASPEEVEKGILLAVEEAVRGLDGVKRVTATAQEGSANVSIELLNNADAQKALQDIKAAVDRISSLPQDAERPVVSLPTLQREVVAMVVYGNQTEHVLRATAERVRDELLQDPGVTVVKLAGARTPEIGVEIPQDTLRSYGLTLQEVASVIQASALEVPGGSVKTQGGEILLRMSERRDWGPEFADIPVVSRPDGTSVTLGQIATVRDDFEDSDVSASYNGLPAMMVTVYCVGDQKPIAVADVVKAYIERTNPRLPGDLKLAIVNDWSEIYYQRIDLLLRNARLGLCLVFIALGLFLEIRLAFWVMLGIPISFLGTLLLMPGLDLSLNMVSLFAFIMALGIVVDDAIVVGENVYDWRQRGDNALHAAVVGTRQVAVPVVFSVLTNIVSFMPLAIIPGTMGKFFAVIPYIVCTIFALSLVESMFILPAHLGHQKRHRDTGWYGWIHSRQQRVGKWLEMFITRRYAPLVTRCTRNRYLTVAVFFGVFLVVLGYQQGGRLPVTQFPRIASDTVTANAALPFGSPVVETLAVRAKLEAAAQRVAARHGGSKVMVGMFAMTGGGSSGGGRHVESSSGSNLCYVRVFLTAADRRTLSAETFVEEWRQEAGEFPGVDTLTYNAFTGPSSNTPVSVELSHTDTVVLEDAARTLAKRMQTIANARDVDEGFNRGKPQYDMTLKPAARTQGLTVSTIGRQVRAAFYGAEALRQQRDRDEVKVMVRLPAAERASEYHIENLLVRTPGGGEMPLGEAVQLTRGYAYTSIQRVDGRRVLNVTCDVEPISALPLVNQAVWDGVKGENGAMVPALVETLAGEFPGLKCSVSGSGRDFDESMATLKSGFVFVLLVVYAMLAIPFKSYTQPLIVMVAIPFGIIGAAVGHILMGYTMNMISMFGIIALAGVVVNDSLVMVDYANQLRKEGAAPFDAVVRAGARRFRPIVLTSLTTFMGLAPMIFETSLQARFLIPMALSLGFGILFSTVVALLLLPSLYVIIEDAKGWLYRVFHNDELIEEDETAVAVAAGTGPDQ